MFLALENSNSERHHSQRFRITRRGMLLLFKKYFVREFFGIHLEKKFSISSLWLQVFLGFPSQEVLVFRILSINNTENKQLKNLKKRYFMDPDKS